MSKTKPATKRKTHLTRDDRIRIETFLNERQSIRYIAARLDRSPSTISREIKNHTVKTSGNGCNCIFSRECRRHHVCGGAYNRCTKLCKTCPRASKYCPDFAEAICDYKAEYGTNLCNGCTKAKCYRSKERYKGSVAEETYRKTLVDSRNGFDLTEEELDYINSTVTPLIKKGQSIYHILHSNDLPVSESTLRRLICNCKLDARNIDLRNAVKRRQRRKDLPREYHQSNVDKTGRKYEDYLAYVEETGVSAVQMDCVEGIRTDKAVLLTLHFPVPRLQFAMILNEHTSRCVLEALDAIELSLGTELFKEMFPAILTDNGHEFEDIEGTERSINGGKRTKVFFCEPRHSEQKGSCEKNHELIRYVIPKGTSIESFMQKDISLMMNHVNSYIRKELHGKSAFDVAKVLFPEDFFILLGMEQIEPKDVNLTPSLLK